MSEQEKRLQPKKIKMPPLVDRSQWYDTMSWTDDSFDSVAKKNINEDNSENNSQSISELEPE